MSIIEGPSELDPFIHGPLHLEFKPADQIAEVYRALEDGTLAWQDAKRIMDGIDTALNSAVIEEVVTLEVYKGQTSPNPEAYHDHGCGCVQCNRNFTLEQNTRVSEESQVWYEDALLFPNGRPADLQSFKIKT